MQLVRSVTSMQRLGKLWQRKGVRVGFVPTMGYLHAGHLSLVRRARQLVGRRGKVVVSIYVNPTQFGPREDFSRYPRDLEQDMRLCRAESADVVFAPSDKEMYPGRAKGNFSTFVVEEKLSRGKFQFETRGCLACHTHVEFPEITKYRKAEDIVQGPDLSNIGGRLSIGAAGKPPGVHTLHVDGQCLGFLRLRHGIRVVCCWAS